MIEAIKFYKGVFHYKDCSGMQMVKWGDVEELEESWGTAWSGVRRVGEELLDSLKQGDTVSYYGDLFIVTRNPHPKSGLNATRLKSGEPSCIADWHMCKKTDSRIIANWPWFVARLRNAACRIDTRAAIEELL